MTDISKLNKLELRNLLKKLKLLNSLKKSLWKRGITEYERINNWVNVYKVEYFNSGDSSLSFVQENASESFKKVFWLDVKVEDIQFAQNQNLKWWMRIFFNDTMCDLSYNRFANLLK